MEKDFDLQESAELWRKQSLTSPCFTHADTQEIKYNLIDEATGLMKKGFDNEEAFLVASSRYNKILDYSNEMGEANAEHIQLHRITQVFAGVLVFFLLYFLLTVSSKIFFFNILTSVDMHFDEFMHIYYYVYAFHLIIPLTTFVFYFFGDKIAGKINSLTIRPIHTAVLILLIILLAATDKWLFSFIVNAGIRSRYFIINDYSCYSFAFVFIICFLILYKKYYLFSFSEQKFMTCPNFPEIEQYEEVVPDNVIQKLLEKGLTRNEAVLILIKREGVNPQRINEPYTKKLNANASWRPLLIVLSGVLFYFCIYFFFQATARITFSVLHKLRSDSEFSIRWTYFYSAVFHLIFIFTCTSLYLRDINLCRLLTKIRVRPFHTILIFAVTIFFAVVDRYFFGVSRDLTGYVRPFYFKMEKVFVFIQYSFPLLVLLCFLVLFFKYYRENMKIS